MSQFLEQWLFDKKDQTALLEQWRTCVQYGMTTKDFCQKLASSGSGSAQKIGQAGLSAPGDGKRFTDVLDGWLSPVVVSTLAIAEQNGQLKNGLDIAIKELEGGQGVMKSLWLMMAFPLLTLLGLGVLGVYISGEIIITADLEGSMASQVRDVVSGPGLIGLSVFIAVLVIEALLMPIWTGPGRDVADKIWPFCDYRIAVAGNLLSTLGNLSQAGMSLNAAMGEVDAYSSRYLKSHLNKMQHQLETETNPGRALDTGLLLSDAQVNLNVMGDIAPLATLLEKGAEQHHRHLSKKMATLKLIVPKIILVLGILLLAILVGSAMASLFISIQL
ncbi:type II secretion system F family protein [uncultured Vibrio sp.]|uniref:type II secretion system F family protein n=1 Tax=uncultured Vibrio sp. TaxID=114054 RepID=UPI00260C2920|nr:type II secretion system F family protein [uncultured Vibrio sp.]